MSASQFIQMLENKGLLDPESIVELQKMVEQSKVRVTPEALARILVENGQLTRFQATKLVTELKEQQQAQGSAQGSSSRQPTSNKKPAIDSVDDLLPPEEVEEVVVEVQEVFDDPVAEVVEVVETTETRSSNSKRKNAKSTGALLDDGLTGVAVAKAPVVNNKPEKSPWESFGIIGMGFIVLLLLTLLVPLYIWFTQGSALESW